MEASISPRVASGLLLGGLAVSVLLLVIGAGLWIYTAWEKRKEGSALTADEEAKREKRRKWGIALTVIGLLGAVGLGALMYVRRDQFRIRELFSSPALVM